MYLMRNPWEECKKQQQQVVIANALTENEVETNNNPATLSRNQKTLHTLWAEFEFGLANRKPAKDFTPLKRGRVKYTYESCVG